jgi:hypothetical protein
MKAGTIILLGVVCCVLAVGVVLERRVNLGGEQQDRCRDIEVKEQREGGA